MIIMVFLFLLQHIFGRIFSQTTNRKVTICPKIDILTLAVFYIPIFLIQGLVPAILSARKRYGCTFCLHIPGMKRRIFFITGSHGRNAISKNADLRLPAAQVARVFGISEETTGMILNHNPTLLTREI